MCKFLYCKSLLHAIRARGKFLDFVGEWGFWREKSQDRELWMIICSPCNVSAHENHNCFFLEEESTVNVLLSSMLFQSKEFQAQLEELRSSVHCLEDDLCSALRRADQAENDLRKAHAALDDARRRLADCQEKLAKVSLLFFFVDVFFGGFHLEGFHLEFFE